MHSRIAHMYASALAAGDGLAALQELSTNLAHEINNPLSIVLANVAFALERLGAGELYEVGPALRDAKEASERITRFVREMSRAAGRRTPSLSVDGALRRAVALTGPLMEGRARLLLELAPTPLVNGAEEHLVVAFSCLLANALDGIPAGARPPFALRVRSARRADDVLVELSCRAEGGLVHAPPASGLSLCEAIVTSLGGSVEVVNPGAGGAAVRIVLPGSQARQEHALPNATTSG